MKIVFIYKKITEISENHRLSKRNMHLMFAQTNKIGDLKLQN